MARTQVVGSQVADGSIQRTDLDSVTAGQAVIKRVLPGTNIAFNSTGVDAGTGDVTINALLNQVFTFGGTGTPTTGNDKTPWLRVTLGTLTSQSLSLVAKTAPTGAGFQVAVKASVDDGATFPTTIGTITLASGNNVVSSSVSASLAVGAILRLDIIDVNGAADWTVELRATY